MRYCTRCVYPETSAIKMTFDEEGVCSGCRVAEEKEKINWDERKERLRQILEKYRSKDGKNYDCIVPVSGGKDSTFQTYLIKEVFGMNPLLVTFNHEFNTRKGIRNLANLVEKAGVDHIRFTPNPKLIRKLARLSMRKMGDMCWHCHSGIFTYPVQIAVKFKIPLIIWGEHGWSDLAGMYSHNDLVEMTQRCRREWGLRGFEASDMVDNEEGISMEDLKPFTYPTDKEIESVGVRGIYISNYINWNAKKQTEKMIELYDFETAEQERTYNCYENVECFHCGGSHDYLKWLKFGYGRATDHASQDIRLGRMTREQGIDMVEKYDGKRPSDLDIILRYLGMDEEEFVACVDNMRDPRAWGKNDKNEWYLKDPVGNHRNDPGVEDVRLPVKERNDFILTSKWKEDKHVLM
ncbi:MAG: N-acetyl sugar amidotransferase [Candidatus Diapherotrites archaeon]|uniref:N-acetyl sugar amidotransferase n=1 Tax=Candidatus Iainarchaeum sp. TaxID=3101447 RepID=A0A939C6X3_9ARCH|nr:N-acetyl sugar amidotransferase [Candidatus Diapherotrites archaeon]